MEPKCIEAFFSHLEIHNDLEWWIWLSDFFGSQLMNAIFGF